jgi:nucleotide-binding universal stress UspA family protein
VKKQILVPLDGSQLAEMILPHAVAYARARGYGLALLHIVAPPAALDSNTWGVTPAVEIWEEWENDVEGGRHYLEVVAKRLQPLGLEVHTHLLEDEPASCIVSYAENHPEVGVIAMSTHGRSGLRRLLLGSMAEKVLHSSHVPVLMARPHHEQNILNEIQVPEYRSLLVPLDGSDFAIQALAQAKALAAHLGASLTLVGAVAEAPLAFKLNTFVTVPAEWTPERETMSAYLQQATNQLESEGFQVQAIVEYGPPAEAILRTVENTQADLIVMSTHGRSGLPRLWLGSVAMKVVHGAVCPVLLVRAKERVKEPELQRTEAGIAIAPAY